ncbi:Na+/H+ antiporter NhaC [Oceanobacillus piezotolerans]|uniref:Na+/H+ antiporter NhaC n=2 Tax=Oceanobacillus piezotolerans TaxID=2448030 RepID=A0A498DFR2_9BACI|nr:Na+/H+ antiporter NhaC [Oceanobacillus piezotolerans]
MENKEKEIPFLLAILPMIIMISVMAVTIIKFEGSPHVPLIIGTIACCLIAWTQGYTWKEMEQGIVKGITLVIPAIIIIMLVGLIISSWIGGGIIASMIYYGLKLLTPSLFLVSICLICMIVSLAIGSSWSTMGTIGVAGMGIGISMGIPSPMVAGAIISGSYFGDKMSPLSDTTNLAAGVTNTDLFEHIKHMMYTTIPGLGIALIVYFILGRQFHAVDFRTGNINEIISVLEANFVISPWLFLAPLVVILLVVRKVPALPALTAGVFIGWFCHVFIQGGSIGAAVNVLHDGYFIESGNALVDNLFNRGGIQDMMFTVSLTIVAMTFAGVMEATGMLRSIVHQIMKLAKTAKSLIPATVGSAFLTNLVAAEQYISVLLPGRMFPEAYKAKNLHSKNLSRAIEDGGTLTSPLVPWNTCGVYIFSTLGVSALQYAPFAVLNYTVPIISILFAIFGIKVAYVKKGKTDVVEETAQLLGKKA